MWVEALESDLPLPFIEQKYAPCRMLKSIHAADTRVFKMML